MAARVQDRLAAIFGEREVFMDVDNLVAGQRFDRELQNALAQTDVFLAVIGPRWSELFLQRQAAGERDYVHEEIAAALKRQVVVIPVLIERTSLPRAAELPEDMRDLVLYQEHTVTHENFGRDVASLVEAIKFSRKQLRRRPDGEERAPRQWITPMAVYWRWIAATVLGLMVVGWIGSHQYALPVWWPSHGPSVVASPNNAHFPAVASPFEGEWSANPSRLCWGSSETLYIDAQSVRSTIPSKLTNGATETRVFKILHLNVAGQLALTVECDHEQRELKLVGDTVVGGFTGGVLHKCN